MAVRTAAKPPAATERWLAVVTLFLLSVGVPIVWFNSDGKDVPTGDSSVIIITTAMFALAFTHLGGQWPTIGRAIRREPFLLAFVTFMVASTAWSTTPGETFRRSIAIFLTTMFGYYLVVRFPLREIIRLSAIALMAGTIAHYIWIFALPKYGVSQFTDAFAVSGDWSGVYPHKNSLGRGALLSAVMFVFAARTLPRRRTAYWAFFALNVVLCVGSNSKTALVGLILLLALMALFTGLRAHATLYGGVAFGLVGTGLLAAGFVTTNLGPITESLGKDATLTGRTQLWTDVIHEIGRRPWLGFGWIGYWTGKIDGPSRYVLERNLWNPPNAHNAVLEVMINLGIVGAILFLVPYLRGLFRSIGQVRRLPNILGLFPITYFSLVLVQSITEIGVIGRDLTWTLFVVAVVLAGRDRADERLLTGAVSAERRDNLPAHDVPIDHTYTTDDTTDDTTDLTETTNPADDPAGDRAGDPLPVGDASTSDRTPAPVSGRTRASFSVRRPPS